MLWKLLADCLDYNACGLGTPMLCLLSLLHVMSVWIGEVKTGDALDDDNTYPARLRVESVIETQPLAQILGYEILRMSDVWASLDVGHMETWTAVLPHSDELWLDIWKAATEAWRKCKGMYASQFVVIQPSSLNMEVQHTGGKEQIGNWSWKDIPRQNA